MSVTQLFLRKLKLEMKLLHIVDKKPKLVIKLDPIDSEELCISEQTVKEWSQDNLSLYAMILENGMAEYICNKQFLFEFYKTISFINKNLENIDQGSLKFKNLVVLNLTRNNITKIQNIPSNCKELYLDFNKITGINANQPNKLELLSISNNLIDDQILIKILKMSPELRCINVSWNQICQLKEVVTNLGGLSKLKVLILNGNPISMLAIYYTYITDHLHLAYFDGQKYVKEQVKKIEPKVEEKKEVKQQKKDNKKDNKKGAKVQEKPPEEPKIQLPKQQPKKELTQEDFQTVRMTVKISNLQQITGSLFDISMFPSEVDIKKTQTSYWIKYLFGNEYEEQKQKIITFDNATIENDESRLNLDVTIQKKFAVNLENFDKFNEGIRIQVHQENPKMLKDPETFQLKPQVKQGQVIIITSILGSTHIDLRKLHTKNKKEIKAKYRLFSIDAVKNPVFNDPYENQSEIISTKKQAFENALKKIEQEKIKKAEEQQLLKQQKKGGKDQKKVADKKPVKKDGKEPPAVQKRKSQKCEFPIDQRLYCVIQQNKLYKGKQLLCIEVKIE